jgi:hypothetical protein
LNKVICSRRALALCHAPGLAPRSPLPNAPSPSRVAREGAGGRGGPGIGDGLGLARASGAGYCNYKWLPGGGGARPPRGLFGGRGLGRAVVGVGVGVDRP